jgi:hypothetical protein
MAYVFNPFTGNLDSYGPVLTGTGTVSAAADGTAALPGIAFASDTNTGIYRSGPDQLAISTNGTGRLFVDASGNVAIAQAPSNAASFTRSLNISASDASIALRGSSGGAYTEQGIFFAVDGTNYSHIYNDGVGQLIFRTGAGLSERLRITSDGKLGLGTSSPSYKLHVDGETFFNKVVSSATGDYTRVNAGAIFRGKSGRAVFIGTDNSSVSYVQVGNADIDPGTWPLAINPNGGNVGIGTTSPQTKLEVSDNSTTEIEVARFRTNGNTNNPMIRFLVDETANLRRIDATGSITGALAFNQGANERARIDSSGRLLVGTSTTYAVAGASRRLQVHGTNASDSALSITRWENANAAPRLVFGKSNGALGTFTAVADAEVLGQIEFAGANGTDLSNIGASISAFVDGTPFSGGDTTDLPGRLVFSTTADGASIPTERMRIRADGTTCIAGDFITGSTTTKAEIQSGSVSGKMIDRTTGAGQIYSSRNSTSSANHFVFYNPNGAVGTISTSASATAYNTSSDYRLKENVVALTGAIDRVNQLQVHRFNFIADPDKTVDGFLAHEAQAVVPECVTGTKDEVDADGNPVYQGIDQSKLVPLLTAALQEALAEIESLKARVTALEP